MAAKALRYDSQARSFLVRQHYDDGHYRDKVVCATNTLQAEMLASVEPRVSHVCLLMELRERKLLS